jgi:hypothetical protein
VWLLHWECRTKKQLMQYYGSIRNNWSSESATSIQLRLHYVQVISENGMPIFWSYKLYNSQAAHRRQTSTSSRSVPHHSRTLLPLPVVDSPRQYGGNCHVRGQQPRRPLTKLMTQLQLPPPRPHQQKRQMNFQVGNWMICPIRLELACTTCPQRLGFTDPIKVISDLYDWKRSRSPSRKIPVFLLVIWGLFSNLIFTIFQKNFKKIHMVYVACYNILTIGIDMFQFYVKIIKDLDFFFHLIPLLFNDSLNSKN